MAKDNQEKKYTEKEVAAEMYKSVYKSILKAMRKPSKDTAQEIVSDINDDNYEPEVDPDKIPTRRQNIVNKSTKMEKKRGVPKGVSPDKHERCVKDVKQQGHDKESAIRICNDSLQGKTKKSESEKDNLHKNIQKLKEFRMKKLQNIKKK